MNEEKVYRCKDCRHLTTNNICMALNGEEVDTANICSRFETPDGKRPRFCRLASSVDEMAKALVHYMPLAPRWIVWTGEHASDFFSTHAEAVDFAKKWLMEVE